MATALDTSAKTNNNLSGGNLVATSTGAGGVRSDRPLTGLTYFSGVITTLAGTPRIGISVRNMGTSVAPGADNFGLGYASSGAVTLNNVTLATLATFAQGNRIDVAIDTKNRLIYFRVNNGNWNNGVGNDPTTQTGGIDFSSMNGGALVAAAYASITGTVWTMEFSTPFTDTAPTGYASLDAMGYTNANSTADQYAIPSTPAVGGLVAPQMPKDGNTQGKHFNGTTITVVSGVTKEAGVAVGGRKVEVYDRWNGDLLGCTVSDGSGNWSVPCLGRATVRVVGSDPTTYNSVVFDNVPGV